MKESRTITLFTSGTAYLFDAASKYGLIISVFSYSY